MRLEGDCVSRKSIKAKLSECDNGAMVIREPPGSQKIHTEMLRGEAA